MGLKMFLQNKYYRWYNNIIANAKNRIDTTNGYYERHHIIPECFFMSRKRKGKIGWIAGDPGDDSNIVVLTAKEHFICHKLLTKFTTGVAKNKMIFAFWCMTKLQNKYQIGRRISSHYYEKVKQERIEILSECMRGENNPMYGKKASISTRNKMSKSRVGKTPWNKDKTMTAEHNKNISMALSGTKNPMYGKNHTEPTKRLISEKLTGRENIKIRGTKRTTENKQKISKTLKTFYEHHVAINNGEETKYVLKNSEELQAFLENGYSIGKLKPKITKPQNRPKKSWVTNGQENKLINASAIDEYLENGWFSGRYLENNDRIWIKKEDECLFVQVSELSSYLLDGWIKGRIIKGTSQ